MRGGDPISAAPHLKGYPNCTEMALISLVSPLHFTVAPLSPLKEPHAPKAKMAKSCGRGAQRSGGAQRPRSPTSPLPPPPTALSHSHAGRDATPQLSAVCASSVHQQRNGAVGHGGGHCPSPLILGTAPIAAASALRDTVVCPRAPIGAVVALSRVPLGYGESSRPGSVPQGWAPVGVPSWNQEQ